ncbi:hypothetical protein IPA_04685 [Ignicoccus pacificus DSM 13166]|uniref:Uncharacterized protein n=1 Tax=Ignicoccus pacificus DSM 13166 TaxID=940294 RepID=A0A977KB53_9CREN|nr:hypothetical protein IPA_04685 [Ignicoccus pacificus DSM 13166]
MRKILTKALTIDLTTFEWIMVILSLIAVLGWLFLVYKVSVTLDTLNKSLAAALGA